MSHLIQPIMVLGALKCVKTWRTDSVLSLNGVLVNGALPVGDLILNTEEAHDSWRMSKNIGEGELKGAVSFGTSCLSGFTLTVNYDKDSPNDGLVEVIRNTTTVWSADITRPKSTEDTRPPLNPPFVQTFTFSSDRPPCGDVWTIRGFLPPSNSGIIFIRFNISAVS